MRSWWPGASKWDRALGVTLAAGVAMLLLVGLFFVIANGSRRITADATSLHDVDEVLRSSTVARAQLSVAVHAGEVDAHFGADSSEAVELSLLQTEAALAELRVGLEALLGQRVETGDVAEGATAFMATARQVVDEIERGAYETASGLFHETLGSRFDSLVSSLVERRDSLAESVRSSEALLTLIGNVARFLIVILLPAAVVLIYRDLRRRQARQAELESRLEAARQVAEAREEFIANASHELRTPLTSITGLAMLLEEVPTIRDDEASAELLDLMISESLDLNRMVEDLLTTARLDAGALSYTFQDVSPVREIDAVADSFRRAGVRIEAICEPAQVRADSVRFRQIIRNLLSNASKYGGSDVRVLGYVEGSTYTVEVIDDGDGVSEEIADRLFQRFVHQGRKTPVLGSIGLGLSIVHALTQGMGGSVGYRRTDGETRFSIRLPLANLVDELDTDELVGIEAK